MSSATPRTWFSGKSGPGTGPVGPDSFLIRAGLLCFVVLLSPIGALVCVAGYLLFTACRFSWRVIGGATAIYALLFTLFGGMQASTVVGHFTPLAELSHAVSDGSVRTTIAENWLRWLLMQAPLAILLGGVAATAWTGWRWLRRPSFIAYDRAPTPVQMWRRRRVISGIARDERGPVDAITVGVGEYGHRVVQTDAEGAAHTLVVGASGSGKTTTMLTGMRDVIRLGRGLVIVDLKGGPDVPAQLAEWSARYGRRFLHWSMFNEAEQYDGPAAAPAFYDPAGRGDASRRKDLILGSQKWDVEYYKTVIGNYLQAAFSVAAVIPPPAHVDTFTDISALLDPRALVARAQHIPDGPHERLREAVYAICTGMEESERSGIRNMYARLQTLTGSTAGPWLKKCPHGERDIDLRRAADEGWVVVFSLDSSNYEETSAQIAGLIIQDLKTVSSELRQTPAHAPLHVYVDEFAAAGSDNVLGLLNKARDAKMPVTLSTQVLADLTRADPEFGKQVLGIVNCFMIHHANTDYDAEVYAGLTGKHTVHVTRLGVEMTSGMPGSVGTGAATGQGFVEERLDFRVLPSEIQDLGRGQVVYVANAPQRRVEHPLQVIREDPVAASLVSRPEPSTAGHTRADPSDSPQPPVPGAALAVDSAEPPAAGAVAAALPAGPFRPWTAAPPAETARGSQRSVLGAPWLNQANCDEFGKPLPWSALADVSVGEDGGEGPSPFALTSETGPAAPAALPLTVDLPPPLGSPFAAPRAEAETVRSPSLPRTATPAPRRPFRVFDESEWSDR
jgi:hypothetical protein